MESTDQYNFSIFKPRHLHGRKNRNVILTMLLIWSMTVFGFQVLLRVIEKPTPEKTLEMFESTWPMVSKNDLSSVDYKTFLTSLILVKGKNLVKPEDQKVLSDAISSLTFMVVPDSIRNIILADISDLKELKLQLVRTKDQEYLNIKTMIGEKYKTLIDILTPYSGYNYGSIEAPIFIGSLEEKYPESLQDASLARIPEIMKFYLTHNQSVLTDTKFLGFPFHYFYTAVFLLILFIALCIAYNILVEWRLKKEGIVE